MALTKLEFVLNGLRSVDMFYDGITDIINGVTDGPEEAAFDFVAEETLRDTKQFIIELTSTLLREDPNFTMETALYRIAEARRDLDREKK